MKNSKKILLCSLLVILLFVFYDSEENDAPFSKALNYLDSFSFQRAYPNAIIPGNKYFDSFAKADRLAKSSISFTGTWENIGPYNQGGRTLSLAVDPFNPDIVYAGSASGGLWRLTFADGGSYSWENIETGFPVLGVGAIAINPANSDEIYIGTGEVYAYQNSDGGKYRRTTRGSYGIGILKSTDGGATWEKSLDWSYAQEKGVQVMEIDPVNTNVVFAGTSEGMYRSNDSGETWELVNPAIMAVDIVINHFEPNIIIASHGNFGSEGNGLYKSINGGDTWAKLSNGLPSSWSGKTMLDSYKRNPNIIYADVADTFESLGLYMSTDSGESWNRVSTTDVAGYQGWFAHYVRVNPVDSSKVFLAGIDFAITEDETNNIDIIDRAKTNMHVDHHAFANHPTNPDIVYFANDGGVYRTTEGATQSSEGFYAEDLNDGYVTTQFYNGFSSSISDSLYAMGGLQDNNTAMYLGDKNWQTKLLGGDGAYTAINDENRNVIYASAQYLGIYRSDNRGIGWIDIGYSLGDRRTTAAFIAPYILLQPNKLVAATNAVFFSNNSGMRWETLNSGQPLNGNSIIALAIPEAKQSIFYAATVPANGIRAEVFKSVNSGDTWENITGVLPDRFITELYASSHDLELLYAGFSGFGTSHLFRSENGGDSWQDIGNGLPDVPLNSVIDDPGNKNYVYVGNDLGVWVSTDFAQSWSKLDEGMPTAAIVMDLSISQSNRKIRAVSHGNGVYERKLIQAEEMPPIIDNIIPDRFILNQNYPNPFNPITTISFELKEPIVLSVQIFDVLGRVIKDYGNKRYKFGSYKKIWDGKNDSGLNVSSGVYIFRITDGSIIKTKKMTLLK